MAVRTGQPCLFRVTKCLLLPLPCCRNSFLVQSMAAAFRALNEIMVMPVGVHGVPGQDSPCEQGGGCELLPVYSSRGLAIYKQG